MGEQLVCRAVWIYITFINWVCYLIWVQFMAPKNSHISNFKDPWSQIIITNIIIMKKLEILQELLKCYKKWSEQMLLLQIDLPNAGLPHTFNFRVGSKRQYLWNTVKPCAVKQGVLLYPARKYKIIGGIVVWDLLVLWIFLLEINLLLNSMSVIGKLYSYSV